MWIVNCKDNDFRVRLTPSTTKEHASLILNKTPNFPKYVDSFTKDYSLYERYTVRSFPQYVDSDLSCPCTRGSVDKIRPWDTLLLDQSFVENYYWLSR